MKKSSAIVFAAALVLMTVGCKKKKDDPIPNKTLTINSQERVTDAYVVSWTARQTTNYGASQQLFTSAWTYSDDPGNTTALIQFDYSDLPAGSTVKKATIYLYADTSNSFNTGAEANNYGHFYSSSLENASGFTIKRITSSWSESTVIYTTKPTSVSTNSVSAAASEKGKASKGYTLDVTNLVKDQIANTNYGFEIALNNFQTYNRFAFYSSESVNTNLRPKMVIEY